MAKKENKEVKKEMAKKVKIFYKDNRRNDIKDDIFICINGITLKCQAGDEVYVPIQIYDFIKNHSLFWVQEV